MAELRRIPISAIHVGERQRPIDRNLAMAIAASMEERGLINPITVRRTPRQNHGSTPWTLVAGGHRLEGGKINGWTEIDVIVVAADETEAVLIELSENIFRNDLTALNRVVFVSKFRETWEDMYGAIKSGRPKKLANVWPINAPPGRELTKQVQNRLGIGLSTYKQITQVARLLHPVLREAIRGTDTEDNMTRLKRLAGLDAGHQVKLAAVIRAGGTLESGLKMLFPDQGRAERRQWNQDRFFNAWHLMSKADQDAALEEIGAIRKPLDHFAPEPVGPRVFLAGTGTTVPLNLPLSAVRARGNKSPLRDFCDKPFHERVPPFSMKDIDETHGQMDAQSSAYVAALIDTSERMRKPLYEEAREQAKIDKRKLTKAQRDKRAREEKDRLKRSRKCFTKLAGYFNQAIAEKLLKAMLEERGEAWLPLPPNWEDFHEAGGRFSEQQLAQLLHFLSLEGNFADTPFDFQKRVQGFIWNWEDEQEEHAAGNRTANSLTPDDDGESSAEEA